MNADMEVIKEITKHNKKVADELDIAERAQRRHE